MKERPILFSAPMVRAILGWHKSQTRRLVKNLDVRAGMPDPEYQSLLRRCPYGQPGDRLWVRETFAIESTRDYEGEPGIDPPEGQYKWDADRCYRRIPRYRATAPETQLMIAPSEKDDIGMRWTPSIFMPRWASRILLEVTDVHIERLQELSEYDAKAEGCSVPAIIYPDEPREHYSYVDAYRRLWESINGHGSWEANPWVWCVSFRVVK